MCNVIHESKCEDEDDLLLCLYLTFHKTQKAFNILVSTSQKYFKDEYSTIRRDLLQTQIVPRLPPLLRATFEKILENTQITDDELRLELSAAIEKEQSISNMRYFKQNASGEISPISLFCLGSQEASREMHASITTSTGKRPRSPDDSGCGNDLKMQDNTKKLKPAIKRIPSSLVNMTMPITSPRKCKAKKVMCDSIVVEEFEPDGTSKTSKISVHAPQPFTLKSSEASVEQISTTQSSELSENNHESQNETTSASHVTISEGNADSIISVDDSHTQHSVSIEIDGTSESTNLSSQEAGAYSNSNSNTSNEDTIESEEPQNSAISSKDTVDENTDSTGNEEIEINEHERDNESIIEEKEEEENQEKEQEQEQDNGIDRNEESETKDSEHQKSESGTENSNEQEVIELTSDKSEQHSKAEASESTAEDSQEYTSTEQSE